MPETTEEIALLLVGYLNGTLKAEALARFEEWLLKSEDNRAFAEQYTQEYTQAGLDYFEQIDAVAGWKKLTEKLALPFSPLTGNTDAQPRSIAMRPGWVRYAAAVILLLAGAACFWVLNKPAGADKTLLPTAQADKSAGSDKAVLTLADGSTILLDSAANGKLAQQGSIQIIKLESGKLAYQGKGAAAAGMNTITTPRGGQYQVLLPDGSQVWLNAASSIRFPAVFTGDTRTVTITGEAYLEVARDAAHPFYVNGRNMQVQVLGTRFNINAYDDEPQVKTTLLDGAVKVQKGNSQVVLVPGNQAVMPAAGDIIDVHTVDVDQVVAWKNGYFRFDNMDLPMAMRQIARWYDVEVSYTGTIPGKEFGGELPRNVSLQRLLKMMEFGGVKMEVSGNRIVIKGE